MTETISPEDPEPEPSARIDILSGRRSPGDNKPTAAGVSEIKALLASQQRLSNDIGTVATAKTIDYFEIPDLARFYAKPESSIDWPHTKFPMLDEITGELDSVIYADVVYAQDLDYRDVRTTGVVMRVTRGDERPADQSLYELAPTLSQPYINSSELAAMPGERNGTARGSVLSIQGIDEVDTVLLRAEAGTIPVSSTENFANKSINKLSPQAGQAVVFIALQDAESISIPGEAYARLTRQ